MRTSANAAVVETKRHKPRQRWPQRPARQLAISCLDLSAWAGDHPSPLWREFEMPSIRFRRSRFYSAVTTREWIVPGAGRPGPMGRAANGPADDAIMSDISNPETVGCIHGYISRTENQRYRFLQRVLFARRPEGNRDRLSVLQSGHRPRPDHRGDGASPQARRADAERRALSAREHRRAHGRRLCFGHRPRPGRSCPCRCGNGERGERHAQSLPQPPAGAADGGQGALYLAQGAGRHPRHPCAFRAGAVRSGQPGAALYEMGVDAAVGRGRQGGAATGLFDHAERAVRSGLSDDAPRDIDPALEQRRDPSFPRRPLRRRGGRRRPIPRLSPSLPTGCLLPRIRS